VAFAASGKVLASGSDDRHIKLWDPDTGDEKRTLDGHLDQVRDVAFGSDGRRLASGGWDGQVKVWDVATGKEGLTFRNLDGGVRTVGWAAGDLLAAADSAGTVWVWDATPAGR
jgi:WD40 repeat protein